MEQSDRGPRLIIVCGLPGSGKTTLAKELESRYRAVRFCPGEWMAALSLNLYDESRRGKIEALQWQIAQQFLTLGLIVHTLGQLLRKWTPPRWTELDAGRWHHAYQDSPDHRQRQRGGTGDRWFRRHLYRQAPGASSSVGIGMWHSFERWIRRFG
jgi:hypothetical protein